MRANAHAPRALDKLVGFDFRPRGRSNSGKGVRDEGEGFRDPNKGTA